MAFHRPGWSIPMSIPMSLERGRARPSAWALLMSIMTSVAPLRVPLAVLPSSFRCGILPDLCRIGLRNPHEPEPHPEHTSFSFSNSFHPPDSLWPAERGAEELPGSIAIPRDQQLSLAYVGKPRAHGPKGRPALRRQENLFCASRCFADQLDLEFLDLLVVQPH